MGDEGGSEEEDSGTESDEGLPRKGGRRGRKRLRGSEGEDGEGEGEGGAGIWGYIRQAGIIDAEMLKEWDVLDLKEAAAREAVRAEAAKVKAGRKARKAGGEEKRPKEKKGGRRRGGTDGGSDGEEGGLRRLEYRDPVRAAEVERARREALNSLKELFRTVKCAAEGDIAPIRAAIGSSPDGSTLAALLKELCGFNTALSAVAADAGCMGEVHRHAAAAGSAGLLLPEVVRMLGLLPATGSTADCVRASGLLKLLQEYSSGSKEVEGAPVGQAVRASIARVLARWAPTKEAARAHKPIKIMTTHAAFAAGGLKRVEAVKRAPAPAPSPPPAKPRAPTTGTTTNGSTPGHTAGGSAPPTDAAPTDDGGDDDPVISSALEAAKRANEAAKEAAAAAAEADQEATTSSVDFLHIGTFSYGDEEKVTASGKGRDGGIASNGRERSHSGKKVSGRGNTEDKKAGSGGKDSVRSLARRLKEERAARKATASDKTKLRVPSGSASKSHTASGKEKKGEKDEWSFEADLKKHISNLLAPLHVNKRINKEGFHEIRNSSMRKVLEKTRIKTKKESMEYLSNEKNKQRIETLVNGYAKHYKTKLDQGGAKRTQAALPNAP